MTHATNYNELLEKFVASWENLHPGLQHELCEATFYTVNPVFKQAYLFLCRLSNGEYFLYQICMGVVRQQFCSVYAVEGMLQHYLCRYGEQPEFNPWPRLQYRAKFMLEIKKTWKKAA